jgi:Plasmid encoded RepA protein
MAGANVSKELVVRSGSTLDEQVVLAETGGGDPQFLHAVLCQLGLPRNPTPSRTFERTSGRASLSLQAGRTFDGKKWNDQPLPSGTRPRLVLINLCSESVRTRSPDVDIGGSVREFLRRLNIDAGGESMRQFRKQMLALSACHMTLAMATADGTKQIDAKSIDAFQAWHTNDEGQPALWPGYLRLTDKFFESLMEHAVPLQPEAIGQLQNLAFALDVYSWLAHRLCRVNDRNGITLSWATLKGQFGQEYADTKNFTRKFLGALQKATRAYKEARIETVMGGLKLLPSPPPVRRKLVQVSGAPGSGNANTEGRAPKGPVKVDGQPIDRRFRVSEGAMHEGLALAPGWSAQFLQQKFAAWANELGEPLKLPVDRAFVGWVKSFTKGKRP